MQLTKKQVSTSGDLRPLISRQPKPCQRIRNAPGALARFPATVRVPDARHDDWKILRLLKGNDLLSRDFSGGKDRADRPHQLLLPKRDNDLSSPLPYIAVIFLRVERAFTELLSHFIDQGRIDRMGEQRGRAAGTEGMRAAGKNALVKLGKAGDARRRR
jgi:hypothetical protein